MPATIKFFSALTKAEQPVVDAEDSAETHMCDDVTDTILRQFRKQLRYLGYARVHSDAPGLKHQGHRLLGYQMPWLRRWNYWFDVTFLPEPHETAGDQERLVGRG